MIGGQTMSLGLGILAACIAAALYDLALAFQALDARAVPAAHSMRVSLLRVLSRRRRWLGATAMGLAGWPFQVLALTLAPLTVVQPTLALGLLLLLAVGSVALDEPVGRREVAAVLAIIAGVAGLALGAPDHTSSHAGAGRLVPALAILAALAVLPYASARLSRGGKGLAVVLAAGCAYGFTGVSSKLLADALQSADLLPAFLWGLATGVAAITGLLTEMTALQHRRATQVAPLVFVAQVVIPVLLAPLVLNESWATTPLGGGLVVLSLAAVAAGAAILGRSEAVAWLVAHPSSASAVTGTAASEEPSSALASSLAGPPQLERS